MSYYTTAHTVMLCELCCAQHTCACEMLWRCGASGTLLKWRRYRSSNGVALLEAVLPDAAILISCSCIK
eukprot:19901-Heterococcus_DN1.PRE.12